MRCRSTEWGRQSTRVIPSLFIYFILHGKTVNEDKLKKAFQIPSNHIRMYHTAADCGYYFYSHSYHKQTHMHIVTQRSLPKYTASKLSLPFHRSEWLIWNHFVSCHGTSYQHISMTRVFHRCEVWTSKNTHMHTYMKKMHKHKISQRHKSTLLN